MEWYYTLILLFSALFLLMSTGMPIAFCFLLVNMVGMYLFLGGVQGLNQLILSISASINSFILLPIPLFILMGEVMLHAGISPRVLNTVDKWFGRLPGRLGLIAVSGGGIFSALTGVSMASVAMLGSGLVPEMERRGYKRSMSLGPILGSGGLAIMIPPSSLAILVAAIGEISVGKILLAIIVPGMLMAILYGSYIVGRCTLQPSEAPAYDVVRPSKRELFTSFFINILPLGIVLFLVVGLLMLGVATPTEVAATGAIGTFIVAAIYGRFNLTLIKNAATGTLRNTAMIFMIIAAAQGFSQILAFVGASEGLAEFTIGLPLPPLLLVLGMLVVVLILGMFMSVIAIMLITLPIFVPAVIHLGYDPVWFGVMFLLVIEMSTTTPPYGLNLFVMKSVAPAGTKIKEIYTAAVPFLVCDAVVVGVLLAFPQVALYLTEAGML